MAVEPVASIGLPLTLALTLARGMKSASELPLYLARQQISRVLIQTFLALVKKTKRTGEIPPVLFVNNEGSDLKIRDRWNQEIGNDQLMQPRPPYPEDHVLPAQPFRCNSREYFASW